MNLTRDITKYRKVILILIATIFMSLISMLFLWLLEVIFRNSYNNIVFKGIKLGIITTFILYIIHHKKLLNEKEC